MTIHDNHYYTASMLCRRTPSFVSRLVSSTLSPGADPPGPDTPAVTSNSAPTGADSVGSTRINLMQLPLEILVGEILATLPLSDLASLVRVSKGMHHLCQSDYLWQRKFFKEFQYRPSKALRQLGGWKRIYQAMDRVEVYTWGNNSDCRLGYGRTSKKYYESVPKRVQRLDGVGIVQLAPTGWGCHALDKRGDVWAWGCIMESSGLRSDATPRMLKRPRNVVQLVAGRQVVLAKDANGQIWQWCRENKAVEVTFGTDRYTDARGGHSINSVKRDPIVQISAGWEICAALTRSGRVFAWQPPQSADGRYQHRIHVKHSVSLSEQGPRGYKAATVDGDKFVQIAAGTDYIVAVTLLEKVYVFRRLDSPNYSDPNDLSQQQQSPHFPPWQTTLHQQQDESTDRIVIETMVEGSMQERILEVRGKILGEGLYLPVFSEALTQTITATYEEHDQWERRLRHQQRTHHPGSTCDLKSGLHCTASRLTTISAYSKNFALHRSSGKVLLGKDDVQADTRPVVLERFYSDVSQMAFGDHHQGLLTEDGLLRTWGSFSHGALGQGDLRLGCEIPTVVEGPLKNKILIGIGMAGWQSVCLAIDMSEDKVYHAHYDQSFLRTQTIYKGKKAFVDDGYHSPENINGSSVSGSGSRSSSEGFDSSDGEEWTLPGKDSESSWSNDPIYVSRNSPGLTLAGGSAPTSTSWTHSSALYRPLSASCTATCSLLVNPYSHRLGNGSTHSRPTFLRKRSSSMTERHPESSSRRAQEASHGHRGYCYYGGAKEENRASMLALTRLSPIMAVYEPTSATEVDVITRRFSVL